MSSPGCPEAERPQTDCQPSNAGEGTWRLPRRGGSDTASTSKNKREGDRV